ncbi:uncharacterized protein LAESUDRAFT_453632 [Laetiporus sulphureus 93-53]|uniref:Uncharacterized protein n=1 Tax=Laetiporus sulphureus 93-53 TaxID=1314785 RepID=A0A165BUW0_9APHY|nr:uncharacterized protein LAESUDRAFT_453632 [Laetiporus sulphureus 93-53]KZT01698.1 hypothetical protein LAESUDRAFT_453632 [Laetiporus sulphureus 93-53]
MTSVISKSIYLPTSTIPIAIQPRSTRRLRMRARDPGHVRKVRTGPIGQDREHLDNRSNLPVPTNSTSIGGLCERKTRGEKDKEKNVDSYVDTKEAVNGPMEVIPTDVSRQLRKKADEELINNDSLASASLGAQGMVSVTSSAAHGSWNIAQYIAELTKDNVIPTTFSALLSIASLPSINALTRAYMTSSSFGAFTIAK